MVVNSDQSGTFGRFTLRCGVAALALMVPMIAHAQDSGEAEEAQPAGDIPIGGEAGNEILVTATKRERTLQDTPVAVSVTTADTIERAHIRDLKDLASVVPSLRVGQLQSPGNTNFFIRGFGNGANNVGIEPSVGVFIDGVYRSRSAAQVSDFPDVERIEVLRGPQSTLFGKNASAGVISIITEEPKREFSGNVEASYGNYDAFVLKGAVTGPVTQDLAVSLAGGYNSRAGYNHDHAEGEDTNDRDRWFLRGQALYEPNDRLKFRFIADYGRIDENCCGVVNLQSSGATNAIFALGGKVNADDERFDNVVYNNFTSTNDIRNYGFSGQLDYTLGPVTLTSITAWRRLDSETNQDSDFTSADLLGRNWQDLSIKTFTQELRLASNLPGPLNFLLGAYYFNENIDQNNQIQWGKQARDYADLLVQAKSGLPLSTIEFLINDPSLPVGSSFGAGQGLDEAYGLKDEAISLFAQVDFQILPRLTATAGINYTDDSKHYSANIVSTDLFANVVLTGPFVALRPFQFFPPFLGVPNEVEPGKTGDDNISYTARLNYALNDKINFYASYATGYKASSINLSRDSRPFASDQAAIEAAGIDVVNQTYGSRYAGPEKSAVIEAGFKGNWSIASANAAIFYQEIKGFQSNTFTGSGFLLANAGKQSTFGIEFEGQLRPIQPLTLSLALTYLDPTYDSFENSPFGDATGTRPAGIPPLSMTIGGQYDHEFGNGDHLILRADYHLETETQVVEGLPGFNVVDPITQEVLDYGPNVAAAKQFRREVNDVNASITYAVSNGLELAIWGRNLLDNRYLIQIFDSPAQPGSVSGYTNQPRTYGVSARFHW